MAQFGQQVDGDYAMAIYAYTQETEEQLYIKLNKACRTPTNTEEKKLAVYRDYLYHIDQAMGTLVNYQGFVYRGVRSKISADVYKVGSKITWTQLSSCSKSPLVATKFLGNQYKLEGTLFKIYTKTGKEIADYSEFQDEDEVLLAFNKFFTVLERVNKTPKKKKALKELSSYDLSHLDVYVLQQI